jgi:dienelactone hydrolase
MRRLRKPALFAVIAAVVAITGAMAATDYLRASEFVIRASGMQGLARTMADLRLQPVQDERFTLAWRGGALPARRYRPRSISDRPILLVPGVHAAGVDEPRLDGFARNLAAMGHPVVAIGLPDLARYRITPQTTDMIEDAARWLSAQRAGSSRPQPIGIVGISFGGGLSIVAASRLSSVAWVLSFGGHGDLPRTLRFLCTGIQPDGVQRPPHDYGVVIILLGVADRLVPADQVDGLRNAILTFLEASHVDMVDKPRAAEIFERARTLAAELDEPARTLMTYVNNRDVAHLGPVLLPHVSAMGSDAALSPENSPPPSGTVYLLHGLDDNVIPAIESTLLAADLRRRGGRVNQLATPLITHAEVDRTPTAIEVWNLVRFWAGPL